MKIAEGIDMLEITATALGRVSTIYPTLIYDRDRVILIDAGYYGQIDLFKEAFEKAGVPFSQLTMIVLTHQDIDHIGCVAEIKKMIPHVKVYSHLIEKPYIQGDVTPVKLAALESRKDTSPENKAFYEWFKSGFEHSHAPVDETVNDGDLLPCGIQVIFTPGHTPGHICLYHQPGKTLIAGDLLTVTDGTLSKARESINYNQNDVNKSVGRLAHYDIENVISYHGGYVHGNIKEQIARLSAGV